MLLFGKTMTIVKTWCFTWFRKSSKEEVQPQSEATSSVQDDPQRIENIWVNFKKDVELSKKETEEKSSEQPEASVTDRKDSKTDGKVFEFAGETVR